VPWLKSGDGESVSHSHQNYDIFDAESLGVHPRELLSRFAAEKFVDWEAASFFDRPHYVLPIITFHGYLPPLEQK
jgi:hypothetical protein